MRPQDVLEDLDDEAVISFVHGCATRVLPQLSAVGPDPRYERALDLVAARNWAPPWPPELPEKPPALEPVSPIRQLLAHRALEVIRDTVKYAGHLGSTTTDTTADRELLGERTRNLIAGGAVEAGDSDQAQFQHLAELAEVPVEHRQIWCALAPGWNGTVDDLRSTVARIAEC